MAKIYIERSYIEPYDEDGCDILIHIKDTDENGAIDHILAGKVEMTHKKAWIHLETTENGDLSLNYSAGMEGNKWDHITREIIINGE